MSHKYVNAVFDTNNTHQPPLDTEHVITAVEAHWYKSRVVYDENSPTNTRQVIVWPEERVSNSTHNWEYWCKCGEQFFTWENARAHLLDTHEAETN